MSLHRITAGSGYDYLTRQVAAMDSTERGHTGLASYYTEKGEVPGVWVGSGMAGIDGLAVGDAVTAEQMQALFGSGHHPLAAQRAAALAADPNATEQEVLDAIRLGQPFKVYAGDISPYRIEVARRLQRLNTAGGRPRDAAATIEDRARARTEVGLEFFRREFGRDPLNSRELAGHIARLSRQKTTAVAGFDLTFSPVKSISALWALADPQLAAAIERCHHAAVADALAFIERHALFTRTGTNGVRQVEVRGLVAAAFTHRDSRAGDPDLHTHVAVANKVQTVTDARWLSIDSRVLHKAITAASETYNTALEAHLAATVGVRFDNRPGGDPRKRPVREIVGVDPALLDRWSARRHRIVARQAELAATFQRNHGRPPTPVEAIALAQQATLETREAKHEPRTLAEQRTTWRDQARQVLGGEQAIHTMIGRTLHAGPAARPVLDRAWFDQAARQIVERVEHDRSAWQSWHVRAEALRVVRAANVPAASTTAAVDWLVNHVLARYSIPLSAAGDGLVEPEPLRRSDGASVYTVAGSRLYTSTRILAAEQRLLAHAGVRDRRVMPEAAVDLALLETSANGVDLNAGQVLLVRDMATSGARLQLAIAPAGSGKTTAMNALSRAWSNAGGTVIGLAPSAVAAAGLGDQIGAHADTIAKLAWHLDHGDAPEWMYGIGPDTLVIIDEAGMADTLSLDAVVDHILGRGGSVRLIGDDQQLAAIGAGGVLRDIQATHGALRLTELIRFADPAEGSASLALRDGQPEALGFYLDRRRVHVGDPDTMADQLFTAWAADRAHGLDSVMLAPTRELVADLNQRARHHRLNGQDAGPVVALADGTHASHGDVIITRHNDRRLRLNATNWVKNGDRWTIDSIAASGAVRARHTGTGRHLTLPADYVAAWVELGYACTVHTAQGVTADTCHGLLTGDEPRQQAYTMLTRGRHANHAYLVVVGDGDPHTLIHPDVVNPNTPSDLLGRILARDAAPLSATTSIRQAAEPATQLGEAAMRYRDAITFAAHHTTPRADRQALDTTIDHLLPGITRAEAWPALRAQLLTISADHQDPVAALTRVAAEPITAGRDPAAILAWRLDDTLHRQRRPGPLPWLTAVPAQLAQHPLWGPYLTARAKLVANLARHVHRDTDGSSASRPGWLSDAALRPPAGLIADIEVWRAAQQVPGTDRRPTGERLPAGGAARWQRHLDQRLNATGSAALDEWWPLLHTLDPHVARDPFVTTLAHRLAQLASAGLDSAGLLRHATAQGPLPDDHAAAALWWRISAHLTPAVAQQLDGDHHLITSWLPRLAHQLGEHAAQQLQGSRWWPALVTTIERGLQRGWTLDSLLDQAPQARDGMADACQAWVWRLSVLTDPIPWGDPTAEPDDRPHDLHAGWEPTGHQTDMLTPDQVASPNAAEDPFETVDVEADEDLAVEQVLAFEAMVRATMGSPEPTEADIRRMMARADAWRSCPSTPERLVHVNELATRYYEARLPDSWAQPYLTERLRQDITGHPTIRPGYAPDSWTSLVQHLRRQGVTDIEMLTAGLAARAVTGRLIDRFRDRLVFPITHNGHVLGFVGRRNPVHTDQDQRGPKYLNTAETPLFHKGDQLYATGPLGEGQTPVLVEGPMDAIAVTLATGGTHTGVAPLGTSLTEPQATQLARLGRTPMIATDADAAGRAAAQRDYWLLTPHNVDPLHAALPEGTDPADLLAAGGASALDAALHDAKPLSRVLIENLLDGSPEPAATLEAIRVLAAASPSGWDDATAQIADQTGMPTTLVQATLAPMVRAWNADPRRAAAAARTAHAQRNPAERGTVPERIAVGRGDPKREHPAPPSRDLQHHRDPRRAVGVVTR